MSKAYRIKTREKTMTEWINFVFAETKEDAIKAYNNGEALKQIHKEVSTHSEVIKIHEVECNIKEEGENEYTKNYPKKDERPLD